MKHTHKYLRILTLVSLTWGTAAFNSYAEKKSNDRSKETVTVSKKTKEQSEIKEVTPRKPLRKATSEESKFTGAVTFEGAQNINLSYPAQTYFKPSLIITKKSDKAAPNSFASDVTVITGASKKFVFDDEIFNGHLELKATKKDVKLTQVYLTWNDWTVGITKNNFSNIATYSAAEVMQLSWKKDINEMFTVGVGIEEGEEFDFHASSSFTPRKDLPATSARLQYNLPNEFGKVELSGLFRPLGWYNSTSEKTEFQPGFGLNLGGKVNIVPETDILTANCVIGQGIGNYIADLDILKTQEPTSVYLHNGKAKSIMALGAYASHEHHWSASLRSTVGLGLTTILNDHKLEKPTFYKLGAYGTANLVYWFTEHTSFGIEYGTGYRKNANDSNQVSKVANHVKAIFKFKI